MRKRKEKTQIGAMCCGAYGPPSETYCDAMARCIEMEFWDGYFARAQPDPKFQLTYWIKYSGEKLHESD